MKKLSKIIFILGFLSIISLCSYLIFGLTNDNQRLGRDIYVNWNNPSMTDTKVKSLWCGFKGLPQNWSRDNGQQYCGSFEVDMKCVFTNSGDACQIKLSNETEWRI